MNYYFITLTILYFTSIFTSEAAEKLEVVTFKDSLFAKILMEEPNSMNTNWRHNLLYVDKNFQLLPINSYNNYKFDLLTFDNITLNSLYDRSIDYSIISSDDKINYNGLENYNNSNINDLENSLTMKLIGGSTFANANLFLQGNLGSINVKSRNNYYVTNGFNNPSGITNNQVADISKQAFQSSFNISMLDNKTKLEYNQFILINKAQNNNDKLDSNFNNLNNLSSVFSFRFNSRNSNLVTTNGQIFLKYANKLINSTILSSIDEISPSKENNLTYGAIFGTDIFFLENPIKLRLKYEINNEELTILEKYYKLKLENIELSINQSLQLYSNNISKFGLKISYINPTDMMKEENYSKYSNFDFNFSYHHFYSLFSKNNEVYLNINYINNFAEVKYIFAKNIFNLNNEQGINYQNLFGIGNKTFIDNQFKIIDINLSYIRFNNIFLNNISNEISSTNTNSLLFSLFLTLNYKFLKIESKYSINISKNNININGIDNSIPSKILTSKLLIFISNSSKIDLDLISYQFDDNQSSEIEYTFNKNLYLLNVRYEAHIIKNLSIFASVNNIFDAKIPLYPTYYSPGINYFGGIIAHF